MVVGNFKFYILKHLIGSAGTKKSTRSKIGSSEVGVVHTFFVGIGSIYKLVEGSLDPVKITLPL
jgi:hypothetical protein